MAKYRKVKDVRMGSKNMPPKTERQLEASRESGLKTAVLHLSKYQFKKGHVPLNKGKHHTEETLKKIRSNPNIKTFSFKGKHHTTENKLKQSMRMIGRKVNEESKRALIRYLIIKGPSMKNPEIAKRNAEARSLKLPKEVLERVIQDFNSGNSITKIAIEIKVDRAALGKLLKKNGVVIDARERNRLHGKINPNERINQFKKGHEPDYKFKKSHGSFNKKLQEEVKNNEEDNHIIVANLNPTIICN